MKSCDFKDKLIRYPSIAYIAHIEPLILWKDKNTKHSSIHTLNNIGIKALPFSLREMFLKEKAN